jgi:hypothetical protein
MGNKAAAVLAAGVVIASVCTGVASAASDAPADTLRELYTALNSCVHVPKSSADSEITVMFRLKRDGSIIGSPWITYINVPGDETSRKLFTGSVMTALNDCMPIPITDALGGAIAGRAMAISILHRPQSNRDAHR